MFAGLHFKRESSNRPLRGLRRFDNVQPDWWAASANHSARQRDLRVTVLLNVDWRIVVLECTLRLHQGVRVITFSKGQRQGCSQAVVVNNVLRRVRVNPSSWHCGL